INRIWQAKNVACRSRHVFSEPAIRITPQQLAVWAQRGLADSAMKTRATKERRVNDHSVPGLEGSVAAALHHLSDHFVAHDPRIFDGDRPIVDFQISPTDAAVTDPDQPLVCPGDGASNLIEHQLARRL